MSEPHAKPDYRLAGVAVLAATGTTRATARANLECMNVKRLIGGVAIAGVIGASTLGIGAGVADAAPRSDGGTAVVQPVDWHGRHGHDWGHGYGRDYRWGWPGDRWHPWGWPWRW